MHPPLLVVEDDDTIRETIRDVLVLEGFSVTACGNGRDALRTLQECPPGEEFCLVVLDLMLPGLGGLDLCRQLRSAGNQTPILVVSARYSETDRVLGLEVGADDYLIKPFGLRELVARCRALLRRSRSAEATAKVFHHANLSLFPEECRGHPRWPGSQSFAQGIPAAGAVHPEPPPGLEPRQIAGAGLGLRLFRRQQDRRCAHPLAARKAGGQSLGT